MLVRNPSKVPVPTLENKNIEIVKGDLVKGESLEVATRGIHTAYYLVHSMGGKSIFKNTEFARMDKTAAKNFVSSADEAGIKRVIYLGGLGEMGKGLSEHLRSRAEVAEILSSGKSRATILRAAIIVGGKSASFVMLKYLVERLPVMICPNWIDTRIQPISVKDVLAYLTGCLLNPDTAGKSFDIGGPENLDIQGNDASVYSGRRHSQENYFPCSGFISPSCCLLGRPCYTHTVRNSTSLDRRIEK